MTPEQFAYWMQGFVELNSGKAPTEAQWKSITEHLGQIFVKKTPPVKDDAQKAKDPIAGKSVDEIVKEVTEKYHKIYPQVMPTSPYYQPYWLQTGDFPPNTIIC